MQTLKDNLQMSRLGKLVILASVTWFIVFTVYAAHRRSIILQLLGVPVSLGFFAAIVTSVVCVFTDWRRHRWFSLIPFAGCILAIVISSVAVRAIRHAIFVQSLPSYESIVQQMDSGSILVSTNLSLVPQAIPQARLAYAVLAQKNTNGVLTVEFLTEAGFPVKHSGYLYVSSGVIESGSLENSRWPFRQQVKARWFYISD